MADPLKIILHAADPTPLIRVLGDDHAGMSISGCDSYDQLPEMIDQLCPEIVYTVRFAGTPNFPSDALLGENGPRWIAVGGSGVDHLGVWNPDKVTVTNSAGVAAGMMAEYVIGGFLNFTLGFPELEADRSNRHWRKERLMVPLAGRTLLIIGLGHTGKAIAERAKAFGIKVIGTRANPVAMDHVDEVHASEDLVSLLPRADLIAVCVPLLESTRHLLDERAFNAMKQSVIIADVSRGGVVDQNAMVRALRAGHLAGAVIDVFETEPLPSESPLWEAPNVVLSPHCSSVYEGWELASIRLFGENLSRYINGKALRNVVLPDRGY